jgi:uncharacterized membrane protein YcgQ (UPF0703/DUF1980 family)
MAALAAAWVLLVSGCGNGNVSGRKNNAGTQPVSLPPAAAGKTGAANRQSAPREEVIEIKEKMFLAQTNDIYLNTEDYLGKTIKLEGLFKMERYGEREEPYCFVLRYGPGCCGSDGNAGFEVAWDGNAAEEYPGQDDWVAATGTLKTYIEDDFPYVYIALSRLEVLDTRGAEFVSQ